MATVANVTTVKECVDVDMEGRCGSHQLLVDYHPVVTMVTCCLCSKHNLFQIQSLHD